MSEDREASKELIRDIFRRYNKSFSKLAEYDTRDLDYEANELYIQNLLKKHSDLLQKLADS